VPLSGGSGGVFLDCLVRKMKAPFRYYRPCLQLAGRLGEPERRVVTSIKTPGNYDGLSTHVICTTWVVNLHRNEITAWIALVIWRQRYGLDGPRFGSRWGVGQGIFFLHNVLAGSWAHPGSYSSGTSVDSRQ